MFHVIAIRKEKPSNTSSRPKRSKAECSGEISIIVWLQTIIFLKEIKK